MINFPRSINDTLSKCCKNLRQHAPIGQTMKMISTVHLRWGHRLKIFLTAWMRSIALLSSQETSHDVSCNVKLCTVLLQVCCIKKCMDASPPRNATIMTVFPFSYPTPQTSIVPKMAIIWMENSYSTSNKLNANHQKAMWTLFVVSDLASDVKT